MLLVYYPVIDLENLEFFFGEGHFKIEPYLLLPSFTTQIFKNSPIY